MKASNRFKSIFAGALIAAALATSMGAQAQPNPAPGSRADVEASIRVGDWAGAESKVNMALQKHPKSAQAWYWKAQIEERLQNKPQALDALSHAKALDPTLNFASPGAASQMEQRLNSQASRPAQAAQPAQRSRSASVETRPNPLSNDSNAYGNRAATSLGSPSIAPAVAHKQSGGGLGVVFLVLALIIVAGLVIAVVMKKGSAKKAANQRDSNRAGLLKRSLDLKNISEALAKDVKFEGQTQSVLGAAVVDIDASATAMIQRVKSLPDDFDARAESSRLDILEQHIESAKGLFATKSWDKAPSATTAPSPAGWATGSVSGASQGSSGFGRSNGSGYQGNSGYQSPPPAYQPAPVIINNGNSGPDLFSTMLMVNAVESMSHRDSGYASSSMARDLADERYENDRLRDQVRQQDGGQGGYAPAPANNAPQAFDLGGGGGGNDFDDDSRKVGGFDNGGSDNSNDWTDNSSSDTTSDSSSDGWSDNS